MENIDFFISELKTNQDTNIQEEKIIKKIFSNRQQPLDNQQIMINSQQLMLILTLQKQH